MNKKLFPLFFSACMLIFLGFVITLISFVYSDDGGFENNIPSKSVATVLYPANSVSDDFPGTHAQSAVLIDGLSGAVLYSKNSSACMNMASTTKIMTAMVVLENMSLDTVVTVPKDATPVEGSSIYLRENEKITVETLLYGLMLESGNDAAHTLAIACSGSIEEFAALMNETAKKIGLSSTSFANPHGLSAENHYTTAYELAYITYIAMQNPIFRQIVSTKSMVAPSLDGEFTRYFSNHNKLLRIYDGAVGVKTGYTKAAGRCLVSAAEKDGKRFIAVTLNDGNDWNDHMNMLDYAFGHYDTVCIAPENSFAAYNSEGYRLTNKKGVYLTVPKDTSPVLSYSLDINQNSAIVQYFADGVKIGEFLLEKSA